MNGTVVEVNQIQELREALAGAEDMISKLKANPAFSDDINSVIDNTIDALENEVGLIARRLLDKIEWYENELYNFRVALEKQISVSSDLLGIGHVVYDKLYESMNYLDERLEELEDEKTELSHNYISPMGHEE